MADRRGKFALEAVGEIEKALSDGTVSFDEFSKFRKELESGTDAWLFLKKVGRPYALADSYAIQKVLTTDDFEKEKGEILRKFELIEANEDVYWFVYAMRVEEEKKRLRAERRRLEREQEAERRRRERELLEKGKNAARVLSLPLIF